MTSHQDKAAGQAIIKSLLKLLNASEDSGAKGGFQAEITDEPRPAEAQRLTNLKRLANIPDQASANAARIAPSFENNAGSDSSEQKSSPEEDIENRFAAHIVRGMSKLKRE
jgi:hypothetical protein